MVDPESAAGPYTSDSVFHRPSVEIASPEEAEAQLARGHEALEHGLDIDRFKENEGYAADVNMALSHDLLGQKHRAGNAQVYTELHKVGERFLLLPEITNWNRHGATIGGEHSMLDALDMHETSLGPQFQLHALAHDLGLTTETVCAKGYSSDDGQRLTFVAQEFRRQNGNFDWSAQLPNMLQKSPYLDLQVREVGSKEPPQEFQGIRKHFSANIYDKFIDLKTATPSRVQSGFVMGPAAGTDLSPHVERKGSYLTKNYSLYLDAFTGKSGLHEPVYVAAGVKRPHYFELNVDGYRQQVACDYTLDEDRNYANVMLMYRDGQPTDLRFDTVRGAMHEAIKTFLGYYVTEIKVNETLHINGQQIYSSMYLPGDARKY